MDIEKTIRALEKNRMKVYAVSSGEEAKSLVLSLIGKGSTVAVGGSVTLSETGILEALHGGDYTFLERPGATSTEEEQTAATARIMTCDCFLCSSNAITENGELYNVDGRSNRINAMLFGPKSVIVVAGVNKIVPDLDAAVRRVKEIAAPQNCRRLSCETYCYYKGHCVSLDREGSRMTDGCDSPTRICCNYSVMGPQRVKDRVKVILVNETLGY